MDVPTDRPAAAAPRASDEINRASLEATERLRARLTGKPAGPAPSPRPVLPWLIAAGLLIFALGLIANPWFERSVRSRLPFADIAPVPADAGAVAKLDARLAAIETRGVGKDGAPLPAEVSERLGKAAALADSANTSAAANAERLDKLAADVAALTARVEAEHARSANIVAGAAQASAQAQGALTLILVRRAIDGGRPLAQLDLPLRQGFEARYPAAVQAVSALGAQPVTLPMLRRDLAALRPRLVAPSNAAPPGKDWFSTLGDKMASLFGSAPAAPPPAAGEPADLALAALDRADPAGAIAQLKRLPEPRRAAAALWLAAAERYRAGQEALATLETAAAATPKPAA
jgi:hypothetical protein